MGILRNETQPTLWPTVMAAFWPIPPERTDRRSAQFLFIGVKSKQFSGRLCSPPAAC